MDFRKYTFSKFTVQSRMYYYFVLLVIFCSVSSASLTFKQAGTVSSSVQYGSQTKFECHRWYSYTPSTNSCQCLSFVETSLCDGLKAYIEVKTLLTVQQNQNIISTSPSKSFNLHQGINVTKPGYRLLPENISELNDYMCGPLNRKGYLCSDCIDGFGPSMSKIEHANHCYECSGNHWGVMLYLAIVLLPLTLLYLLILIFQIRMTSAPIPCFVMCSQLIVIAFSFNEGKLSDELSTVIFTKTGDTRAVTKVILVLYGIFDLDSISHAVPPFCVSKNLRLYHRVFLGYITAFYPIMLILITWVCIELHDRNFRMIVYLWRPFHRCFVRLRRGWDTKNDLIDVFASFLLLSFVKIMYQTVIMFSITRLDTYSLSGEHLYYSYVSNIDNSIPITSAKYIIPVINPLRMRSRVTVVVLCVCLCVCLSVTTLVARGLISAVQAWYQQNQHDTSKVFNSWISLQTLCSKVMALFTLQSARPYVKYCSYSTRIRVMTRKR